MLVRYGNTNETNKGKLEDAYNAAMDDVLDGKGAQVISASTNGASFTFAQGAGTMSTLEWSTCLETVLCHIEQGTRPSSVTIARII